MFKSEVEGKSHSQNVKFPQRDNVQIGGCWRWRCCTVGPGHTVLPEAFCGGLWYNNRKRWLIHVKYINIVAIFWGMHKQQLFIEKRKSTQEDIVSKEARRGNRNHSYKVPQRDNVKIGGCWWWRCCTVGPGHTFLPEPFFSGIWYNNRKEMTITREYINKVKIEQFLVNT